MSHPSSSSKPPKNGQRSFKRSEIKSVARVFPRGENNGYEAYVKDISRRGLGVYSKALLEVNREVTARLQFTNLSGRTIVESVSGRVVYSNSWDDAYFIGIEFKELIQPKQNPGLFAHVTAYEDTIPSNLDPEK